MWEDTKALSTVITLSVWNVRRHKGLIRMYYSSQFISRVICSYLSRYVCLLVSKAGILHCILLINVIAAGLLPRAAAPQASLRRPTALTKASESRRRVLYISRRDLAAHQIISDSGRIPEGLAAFSGQRSGPFLSPTPRGVRGEVAPVSWCSASPAVNATEKLLTGWRSTL